MHNVHLKIKNMVTTSIKSAVSAAECEQKPVRTRVKTALAKATEETTVVIQETPKNHRNTRLEKVIRRMMDGSIESTP